MAGPGRAPPGGRTRVLTVEQLADYGQPVGVLAELPLGPSPHRAITAAVTGLAPED